MRAFIATALVVASTSAAIAETVTLSVAGTSVERDPATVLPVIVVRLTEESGRDFARLTEKNVGRELLFKVEGEPFSVAVVREPIVNRFLALIPHPPMNRKEMEALADRIFDVGELTVDELEVQ